MRYSIRFICSIICIFVFSTGNAAGFSISGSDAHIKKLESELGIFRVSDLAVGDFGYVREKGLCIDRQSNLRLYSGTEIVSDRSEYIPYIKIQRLPAGRVTGNLIPTKDETIQDARKRFIKTILANKKQLSCKLFVDLFEFEEDELLRISSIDKKTNLNELFESIR